MKHRNKLRNVYSDSKRTIPFMERAESLELRINSLFRLAQTNAGLGAVSRKLGGIEFDATDNGETLIRSIADRVLMNDYEYCVCAEETPGIAVGVVIVGERKRCE